MKGKQSNRVALDEELLSTLLGSMHEYAIFLMDPDGIITHWSTGAEEMKQFSPEEAIGMYLGTLYPEGGAEDGTAEDHLRKAAEEGEYVGEGTRLRHGEEPFTARVTLTALRRDDELVGFSKVTQDLTRWKAHEAALQRSEALFRVAFDAAPGPLALVDASGCVRTLNRAARELLGLADEQFRGRMALDFVQPEDRERARREAEAGATVLGGIRLLSEGGRPIEVEGEFIAIEDEQGQITSYIARFEDVSERREAERRERIIEERLQVVGRMEALGRLAGGMAHDFNNQLSVILAYADLISSGRLAADRLAGAAEAIAESGRRAAELTRKLLMFAGRDPSRPVPTPVAKTLREVRPELARIVGDAVDLEVRVSDAVQAVKLTPSQLSQVLASLAANAKDAMPAGGRVVVRADAVTIEPTTTGPWAGLPPGEYVEIAVSDTGAGMTPEVRQRAIEPFFTTKNKARGFGLGLSVLWGLVSDAGGAVDIESSAGQGTVVRLVLPSVAVPAEEVASPAPLAQRGRGERVLLAEDESSLRQVLAEALESHGYIVWQAADGATALDILAQNGPPALIITDVVMPRMTGPELLSAVAERWPDTPVLVMSGFASDWIEIADLRDGRLPFLAKPFGVAELLAKVRELLPRDEHIDLSPDGPAI